MKGLYRICWVWVQMPKYWGCRQWALSGRIQQCRLQPSFCRPCGPVRSLRGMPNQGRLYLRDDNSNMVLRTQFGTTFLTGSLTMGQSFVLPCAACCRSKKPDAPLADKQLSVTVSAPVAMMYSVLFAGVLRAYRCISDWFLLPRA